MDSNVVNEIGLLWESEPIPNEHFLYMRVHRNWFKANANIIGAFKNHGRGMSTDWSGYSTPHETRNRAERNPPSDYAVIQMVVGQVRNIEGQTVEHTPDRERNNRAHTDVYGEKPEKVRVKFSRIFDIVIPLDSESE